MSKKNETSVSFPNPTACPCAVSRAEGFPPPPPPSLFIMHKLHILIWFHVDYSLLKHIVNQISRDDLATWSELPSLRDRLHLHLFILRCFYPLKARQAC